MNERELIQLLISSLPGHACVKTGAGDDCAVLDLGLPGHWVLFKTDAVVEGVHFEPGTPPEKIGHKALARCLSDIAAMGGTPRAAVVTLGLPRNFDPAFVQAVYRGLTSLAQRHETAIVGGETVANPDRLLLSSALLGLVAPTQCRLRSGARTEDAIFVTGELGGSAAGKHLDFEPRLTEARWLSDRFDVHAMIDLSDGLATDLRHVLHASHVGAELLKTAIPISRAARDSAAAQHPSKPPLLAALTDGEDFELLFTVAGKDAVPLLDAWKQAFPDLRLTCIGKITAEPGVRLRDREGVKSLTLHGFDHFQSP